MGWRVAGAGAVFAVALGVAALTVAPSAAHAGVFLSAACNGDSFDISLDVVVYAGFPPSLPGWPPADWVGLVVERRMVGECADPRIVTAEVLPFPPLNQWGHGEVTHRFTDPVPSPNRWFLYTARAVDTEGGLHDVPGQGDPMPYDHVACGDPVVTRGYLVPLSWAEPINVSLRPCQDTCWGGVLLCTTFDLPTMLGLLDTPVNVYGEPYDDGMPSTCMLWNERIVPVTDGSCGPLPVCPLTWGAVKGIYR